MKKLLFSILISLNGLALATQPWSNAEQAFNRNNLNSLAKLHQAYPKDEVISYLNAVANLNRSQPSLALELIRSSPDNYFRSDLLHQLLSYYFNHQNWAAYIPIYNKLGSKQITANETCGYDLANFGLNNHSEAMSDVKWLVANKMPLWCVSLLASKFSDGNLAKTYLQPFLYDLIINDQTSQFNQLASSFGYSKVKFNLSTSSSNNPYQIVYRIANLSTRAPDLAYSELIHSSAAGFTRQYLFNVIAADAATKLNYPLALQALGQGSNDFVSDDEYEWRVRSYLAANDWPQVATTINAMPLKLQHKNVWRYWQAVAAGKLDNKAAAREILQNIPDDYSYYSLLAQSELHLQPNVSTRAPSTSLTALAYAPEAQLSFSLYRYGQQNSNANLIRLATQNLNYIISQSTDRDIATLSQTALSYGWNEMSIYAATKMAQKYARLSFPTLFNAQYQKYAALNNLDMAYPMGITRQESRFNPNALAFDGGVGLMQIMPATARYIAKKSGSSNCYKNYDCNIKFGTWYLHRLSQQFGDNLIYATAGYNAGPGRAHRWQQAFQSLDNRIQIELIPFKITRDYVQKVIGNTVIYESRLNSQQPVDLLAFINRINNHTTTFIDDSDEHSTSSAAISAN